MKVTLQEKSFVLNREDFEIERGRPKLRWCDELEEDVTQFGCKNWRLNAQSREEWQKLIEEVQVPPRDVVPLEEEKEEEEYLGKNCWHTQLTAGRLCCLLFVYFTYVPVLSL
jgi:hypothetical protein